MQTTFTYKLLDLGGLEHGALEKALNQSGVHGWELVAVLAPQTAIFKRAAHEPAQPSYREPAQTVAAKYRDPKTGDTWSGRGRMATWLAERIKAGGRLEDFLA